MKKKIVSLVLAILLVLSCSFPAMAADSGTDLTITQTKVGVKIGETAQLTATLYGYSPAPVTWSIADPGIASISSSGQVTGKSYGITTATASANGLTATCTVHVAIKGIDVSHYQNDAGPINWSSVKASGIDFVLIKATENNSVDPYFIKNITDAQAAGLHTGAYHFLRAGDALAQANLFLSTVKPYAPDYPLVVDVEASDLTALGTDNITSLVVTFCNAVRAAGFKPMVYTNLDWATNHLNMSRLSDYGLWFARYNHAPLYDGVDIWQYSSTTSVPGISGNVDGDYAYVNYTSVLKSDTVMPYTFGSNSTYTYKITTRLPTAPKAVSTNPNAVSVAYYQKVSDGYLYKITNVNAGTAQIITTASDGSSTSFTANGRLKGVVSDTTAPFTMKRGATYQIKLTLVGGATATPFVSTGNAGVLRVVSTVKSGSSFYVKIQATGTGCTSVYTTMPGQSAIRQCVVTVDGGTSAPPAGTGSAATSVSSDTTAPFTIQRGSSYQFKFSLVGGTSGTPAITTGNGSVLKILSNTRVGNDFFVKVQGVGSGCTSVYTTLPGQQAARQCMVTVA